jgi:hypothetical protein
MFNNLVTYHIHKQDPLPASDALAYQYILAGNGLFVRAETRSFTAVLLAAACTVRGLALLRCQFRLKCPRLPGRLLHAVLADGRRARQPDGRLNKTLYQFHHHGRAVQVRKPVQQAAAASVAATGGEDPIYIRTTSVSLFYRANQGNYQSIMPGYTNWADLRHIAHSPGELHIALERMWQSLRANCLDEISRTRGNG